MTQSTDGGEVVARIRNPVVDAWNDDAVDAPKERVGVAAGALGRPSSAFDDKLGDEVAAAARAKTLSTVAIDETLSRWVPVIIAFAVYAFAASIQEAVSAGAVGDLTNPRYRFGIVGVASPALFKLILAAGLLTIALIAGQKRKLAISTAWLFYFAAVALAFVIPLFILDALQVRPSLPDRLAGRKLLVNCLFVVVYLTGASASLVLFAQSLRSHARRFVVDVQALVKQWDR